MLKNKLLYFLAALPLLFFVSKNIASSHFNASVVKNDFQKHWYDGKAEVSSYTLKQNRYGDIHKGEAVMIFVTEDFSKSKQVKLDHPESAGKDKLPVLKLNFTKSFITGVYKYNTLLSVFTPVDESGVVKSTYSVQEWCGHTFTQLNKNSKGGYSAQEYSYFESEGDTKKELPESWLEDDLWNAIRLNPKSIPSGKVNLIRGGESVRFEHLPIEVLPATVTHSGTSLNGLACKSVEVKFSNRQLTIYYENNFPHKILGWDEHTITKGKTLTTTGRLNKSLRLSYWSLHDNMHRSLRDSLGLAPD
jgi:hypothetical protein